MKHLLFCLVIVLVTSCVSSNGLTVKKVNDTSYNDKIENKLDHSAWDDLLKANVEGDGLVDYKDFKEDSDKLNDYINYLSKQVPNNEWSIEELLAYYINVYNANTIKLIVDNYPVKSIKDVDATISPFLKNFIFIGDKEFSLADIEKGILQKMNEPRIHFAINCASFSCPKLMRDAYTAENVEELMNQAATEFINSEKNAISSNKAELSEIFKWYKSDFLQHSETIIDYINQYSETKINPGATINYIEYNWDLNDVE
ncbi:DUF547 domain-containing protein [Winogradskyella sp. A3E31]|uniref:DUF547 domain-containing protein n=1 Tax=Winogradskyella sp. A3E31 TaxID=3349637 RepID=UPI00398A85C1